MKTRVTTLMLAGCMAISAFALADDTENTPLFESVGEKTSFSEQRASILNKRIERNETGSRPAPVAPISTTAPSPARTAKEQTLADNLNTIRDFAFKQSSISTNHHEAIKETNREILVESGENIVLYVSKGSPNRIRTPFNEPKATPSCEQEGEGRECTVFVSEKGGVITFQTITNRPIGMFITPKDRPDVSINLSIRALSSVPPQDVKISINGYEEEMISPERKLEAKKSDKIMTEKYSQWINDLTIELANGELPNGYTEILADEKMNCRQEQVDIIPGYILNGDKNRIDVYRVVNDSNTPRTIIEPKCYHQGVKFIFAYPSPQIEPGGEAELFIVRAKEFKNTNKRTRLVNRD